MTGKDSPMNTAIVETSTVTISSSLGKWATAFETVGGRAPALGCVKSVVLLGARPRQRTALVGDPVSHYMNCDKQPSGRVAQALEIYRSIVACNECIARNNDVHALTAALMLPCYRAEFASLALELTHVEENELRSVLRRIRDSEPALQDRAPAASTCESSVAADGTGRGSGQVCGSEG
jgi:hypothetical protein